jgi:SAM-dependent methyltransferase
VHDDHYSGSAEYYSVGRMPYPAAVADALGLTGSERLLDVGCGPGSLTLLLAPRVRSAVGIDANAEMVAVAAARAEASNVQWRVMRAEELPADLGAFDIVTFAQSFHWMDQPVVAAAVHGMLTPGGRCVLVGATTHRGDDSEVPYEEILALVESYVGPPTKGVPWSDELMRAAGLSGPERIEVDAGGMVTRTRDEIVASVFSLSYAAPGRFGDRRAEFEARLRALLDAPVYSERRRDIVLETWRTAAG